MTGAAMIGFTVMLLYAVAAPGLGRRLRPATATRLLVPASVVVTASGLLILAVMAFTWVGQYPEIAEYGAWSSVALRTDSPVPAGTAAVSGLLVLLAVSSAAVTMLRRATALVRVYRACRGVAGAGGLVVIDDPRPEAFATPQPAARIVVTSGMLRALSPEQRRVLLAHEASHLIHRHAWWNLAADVAAAVNPLLGPTARSIATAVERWADEDAARAVRDRRLVARTLARVAFLQADATAARPAADLAATGGDVVARVRALLAPPPRRRPLTLVTLLVLVLAAAVPAAAVQHDGENLFEHAATSGTSHPA